MAALRARRLVWSEISLMRVRMAPISLTRAARARVRSLEARMSLRLLEVVAGLGCLDRHVVDRVGDGTRRPGQFLGRGRGLVTAADCSVVVAASSSEMTTTRTPPNSPPRSPLAPGRRGARGSPPWS